MPFLTPDVDEEGTVCFSITVPDSLLWRAAAVGAIQELFQLHNWEEFGLSKEYVVNRLFELNPDFSAGDCTVACTDVLGCIESYSPIQTAIINQLVQNGSLNPNLINPETTTGSQRFPEVTTEALKEPPAGCDKDILWAGIREVVERLDQQGRDLLEDLQVINDKVEQVNNAIGAVPLLGTVIGGVGDFFAEQIPDILNAYNSYSSPTALDVIACDLFDLVCADCKYPTFEQVFNYLQAGSIAGMPNFNAATYAAMWDLVKTITLGTPSIVWFTVNAWQAFTLGFGGAWNGSYGKRTFGIWASFGEDLPNDNWLTLCGACEEPPTCDPVCASPLNTDVGCLANNPNYPVTTAGGVNTTVSSTCGLVFAVSPGGSIEIDFQTLRCMKSIRIATGKTSGTAPNYGIDIYIDNVLQISSVIPASGNNNFPTNKTYTFPSVTLGQKVKIVNTGNTYWVHKADLNYCDPL